MAITRRTNGSVVVGPSDPGGNTSSVTKPAGIVDGDIMLAFCETEASSVTISSTGWTQILSVTRSPGNYRVTVLWKRASSEPASWTFTHTSASWRQISIVSYVGCVSSGDPQDATATNSTTDTATGLTTATDGAMLVMGNVQWDNATRASWTSPLTEYLDGDYIGIADGVQTSAGASGNKSVTVTGGGNPVSVLVALKPEVAAVFVEEPDPLYYHVRY